MRVAIYVRVSTDSKKDNKTTGEREPRQNVETQLLELREYAKRLGWEIVATYRDTESGASLHRKNLTLLIEHAQQRKFDVVLVWAVDRFSRSLSDLINTLARFKAWGIRFVSYTQNIDTGDDSPMSKMLVSLLGMFAEFERGMIRERVMAGLARAKSKGVKLGPKPLADLKVGYIMEKHREGDSLRVIRKKYRDKWGVGVSIETIRKYIGKMKQDA